MISLIMPAKDVAVYVGQAVETLLRADYTDWELIVVEDHSADTTLSILRSWQQKDSRIRVYQNKGAGKVAGLNYGYSLARGDIVKCIDADDVLAEAFFEHVGDLSDHDATCHGYYVTGSDLTVLAQYSLNRTFLARSFDYCAKHLISLPRCVWTFTRRIGDVIFPMPEDLPFEDVWFSLVIKKYAGPSIKPINVPLYYYRQHRNQVYGGILNFDKNNLIFRAKRMLRFIDVIEHEPTERLVRGLEGNDFFRDIGCFYRLLADEQVRLWDILRADISIRLRSKLLVYRKLGFLAPAIVRLKWRLDRL